MSTYGQFCPVSKTSELLCERWMPLIVRELLVGSQRFNEIHRGVPQISPALLSKRLRQLVGAGVVDRVVDDIGPTYVLTDAGWELYPIIEAMGVWGQRWARSSYTPDDLDPALLMWDVRRMLRADGLRDGRTVIQFDFTKAPPGTRVFWLVVDDGIDLCMVEPGHDVDLYVRSDLRALTRVWMGDDTMHAAIDRGQITLHGNSGLTRRFPDWFGHHPVLGSVAPAR